MATCQDCQREMTTAKGCTVDELLINGERFTRHRVGGRCPPGGRCGDCGARQGNHHHLGCDLERCPRCGWQLVSCSCSDLDDERSSLVGLAGGAIVYPAAMRGVAVPPGQFPFRS